MSTLSMTAFSRHKGAFETMQWTWELRSVNHRYLELHFKLPELLRPLEPKLREMIKHNLHRGKVDISLKCYGDTSTGNCSLNEVQAETVLKMAKRLEALSTKNQIALTLSLTDLLKWPGIVEESDWLDNQAIHNTLLESFEHALNTLIDFRKNEGAALKALLLGRVPQLRTAISLIAHHAPEIIQQQKAKILQRLQDSGLKFQPERLEQELVYYAQKLDISEEIDRLNTHITEVENVIEQGGAIGRRLDFLMQELHREANTLGAKSAQITISNQSIDLKVLIEQMREQVQNIE